MDLGYLTAISYLILMFYLHFDNCEFFHKVSEEGIGIFTLLEVSVESILHCALACSMELKCYN